MQPIELMACMGCQIIIDQNIFPIRCPKCGSRFYKAIQPTKITILRWFLNNPKHVLKLVYQDIKDKFHETAS